MWKPTKAGTYLLCGDTLSVSVESWGGVAVADGPWSLMGPDWQPGAPTVAQLSKWPWWALQYDDCLVVGTTLADEDFDTVECSAPVQFDLSNGPLWVPLEVCK